MDACKPSVLTLLARSRPPAAAIVHVHMDTLDHAVHVGTDGLEVDVAIHKRKHLERSQGVSPFVKWLRRTQAKGVGGAKQMRVGSQQRGFSMKHGV